MHLDSRVPHVFTVCSLFWLFFWFLLLLFQRCSLPSPLALCLTCTLHEDKYKPKKGVNDMAYIVAADSCCANSCVAVGGGGG